MSRDELRAAFQAKARQTTPVEIAGLGKVYVRQLKLKDQRELKKRDDEADERYAARLTACILCDENGADLFDPANEADIQLLMDTDLKDLDVINKVNAPAGN